jgi:hypothetical protein
LLAKVSHFFFFGGWEIAVCFSPEFYMLYLGSAMQTKTP